MDNQSRLEEQILKLSYHIARSGEEIIYEKNGITSIGRFYCD